jgi:hypothetical protein
VNWGEEKMKLGEENNIYGLTRIHILSYLPSYMELE